MRKRKKFYFVLGCVEVNAYNQADAWNTMRLYLRRTSEDAKRQQRTTSCMDVSPKLFKKLAGNSWNSLTSPSRDRNEL